MAVIDDNLAGLRDRVRRWLHETDSGTSFWSNTFIDQMINASYRRRSVQLVMAFEGYFVNVATRDLVGNQERYAWPPGFERLQKMEIIRSDGTRVPLERAERHFGVNFVNVGGVRDSFKPNYRSISGGFVLEPMPTETVVDGLRIEFTQLPALLQANGDSLHTDFPRSLDEIIVLDATIACLDSENLLETGATRTALRARQDWEFDFARFIDSKMISTNKVIPFNPHYSNS